MCWQMTCLIFDASIIRLLVGSPSGIPDCEPQSRRHGVTDLPVLLDGGSVKLVGVRESLAPGALSDRHNPVMNAISKGNLMENMIAYLFCSGCMTLPCFPIGSGFVMVVEKYPSHSTLPYKPAQLLCLNIMCVIDIKTETIKLTHLLPV